MKRLFFFLAFLDYSKGCAKTSRSGIVDTTIAAGATTITTTTSCSSCSVDNFNANKLNQADPNNLFTHSADKMAGPPQNGCSTMVLTCNAQPPNTITSMSLFLTEDGTSSVDVGDPNNPPRTLPATLVCNTSGQWTYTQSEVTSVILAANCVG